jgi:hypothetical protein
MYAMLQRGDHAPHFHVTTLDGRAVDYSAAIWQRRNLVLVIVPGEDSEMTKTYARQLSTSQFAADTECVMTKDHVEELPAPSVLIADRYGEIIFATNRTTVDALPSVEEILDWVEYLRRQCPECEGEAR